VEIGFTTDQAPGALSNGTRVMKATEEPGDAHARGALATILGSIGPGMVNGRKAYGYFVEWDDRPGLPVFVADYKIEPLS
jgi:hypothetical protein